MSNFNVLFDQWASSYDDTVYGEDHEYVEVFENYTRILDKISTQIEDKKEGTVVEIGVGTGNLSELLVKKGFHVIGIEPSYEMRKVAKVKVPSLKILDGHFLSLPLTQKVDAFVASYAFHHLTYHEKIASVKLMDALLKPDGKIVIADTMFETRQYKAELLEKVKTSRAFNLLKDLNTEFYEMIEDLIKIFRDMGYTYELEKMNRYVWILTAQKN
ncbi:class I SAM-dependent methyltransferase [Defluviitalea saccharophila]|uniref:Class I SAM-dependent methyltransferase n=1 Tax=Defluviitalea saccharophila TaxID=879970 RepID=A0ABZ2Y1K2_9FIRM